MRHWLCCDGGGTKLIMLLVDEDLTILHTARAGGVNPNFLPEAHIRGHLRACVGEIVEAYPGQPIKGCISSMPSPTHFLQETLTEYGIHTEVTAIGEGLMGLLAGICGEQGFTALSGTGSDVFYTGPAGARSIGGWGILLGDEGSGAHIGQRGLIAAIHALEGRGPETALIAELSGWLGQPVFASKQGMGALTAKVYSAPSPRAMLASFAPMVSRACDAGDAVAGAIIDRAGADMAGQMTALIRRVMAEDPACLSLPSTLCGGAWKGSRRMYRAYLRHVLAEYPGLDIRWPLFDAVAGGAARIGLNLSYSPEEIRTRLTTTFADYLYPKEQP